MSGPTKQIKKGFANIRFKVRVVAAQLPEMIKPGERKVFNLGPIEDEDDADTAKRKTCLQLVAELSRYMLRMKADFMSDDGHSVDYRSLRQSSLFREYNVISRRLRDVDLTQLSEGERKAFCLNVYNVLTLHGMVGQSRLPSSPLEVRGFWRRTCYNIGGLVYSLDDIEHGLLRGNKVHSGKLPFKRDDDPRRRFSNNAVDPRIHFALVCGAKSCPAISVFTPENVERALDCATRNYVQHEIVLNVHRRAIEMPRIFHWYGEDFGHTKEEVIGWCTQYMSKEQLLNLELLNMSPEAIDLHYTDYNWKLNALPPKQSRDTLAERLLVLEGMAARSLENSPILSNPSGSNIPGWLGAPSLQASLPGDERCTDLRSFEHSPRPQARSCGEVFDFPPQFDMSPSYEYSPVISQPMDDGATSNEGMSYRRARMTSSSRSDDDMSSETSSEQSSLYMSPSTQSHARAESLRRSSEIPLQYRGSLDKNAVTKPGFPRTPLVISLSED